MKPLVYWCRWHEAKLRLMGRDETAVWGELAFVDGVRPFRYRLQTAELEIEELGGRRTIRLDEMGVAIDAT